MGMKSWTEEGYGYRLFNGSNMGKVKEFIISNAESFRKEPFTEDEIQGIRDAENEHDISEYTDDPVPEIVAEIIRNAEGLTSGIKGYQSDGETDQEAMLGIKPMYPWQSDYKSKEECNALLKKYAETLGITEEPDFFTAEYYG